MLTTEQKEFVDYDHGHALVSAVAGSGKSTALVHKIESLLRSGITGNDIAVLMFNVSATIEFKSKMCEFLHGFDEESLPEIWTFHSFARALNNELLTSLNVDKPNIEENQSVWLSLVEDSIIEANRNHLIHLGEPYPFDVDSCLKVLSDLDLLKNFDYPFSHPPLGIFSNEYMFVLEKVFDIFETKRAFLNIQSLNDLLYDCVYNLRKNNPFLAQWSQIYKYIIVDEYQDSNNLQQWLIVNLSKNAKVIAVGDEDQCIYTWRGANPDYMTSQFEHDFPGTKKFKFSYTFRYGHQIALFANHIIVNNINRTDKLCVSPDNKSYINLVYSDDHGDDLIPHLNLNEETTILLREYNHGDDIELYLLKNDIKYKIDGVMPFLERDNGLFLKFLVNVVKYKEKAFVSESILKILIKSFINNISINQLYEVSQYLNTNDWYVRLTSLVTQFPHKYQMLFDFINDLKSLSDHDDFECIVDLYKECPLIKLSSFIKKTPIYWLRAVSLLFSKERIDNVYQWLNHKIPSRPSKILITSVHKAKGMGWDHVILPHLEEGNFPSWRGKFGDVNDVLLNDERRLFYVACTRAKKKLTLMSPFDPALMSWNRIYTGSYPDITEDTKASRFLYEGYPILSRDWGKFLGSKNKEPGFNTPITMRYNKIINPEQKTISSLFKKLSL